MAKFGTTLAAVTLITGMFVGAAIAADDLGNGGGKDPGGATNCTKPCNGKNAIKATGTAASATAASVKKPSTKADGSITGPVKPPGN